MTAEFLITSIIVVLLPGTGVLYTLAIGLGQGARASVFAAIGCTLGIVPHITASIVGLAAILHASALAFQAIKYLGVIYLFYMAWTILRSGGALDVGEERRRLAPRKIVTSGIALNVLNPKLSLFFLAFLPQFVPATATHPTLLMLGLALVFMALTFIVFVGYGAFAALARDQVVNRPAVMRWMKRSFAAAFAALGLRLAFAER
ncbi:LysE family translocator [Oceaniradius stylonematis]|jgi:threonine/homoserine/homoserine lactone efflux protein|uniref:LysE family translocator n=1 Tax=Oceaniradius stylonematis TaxID=2184161 RepID=UPI0035CE9FA8